MRQRVNGKKSCSLRSGAAAVELAVLLPFLGFIFVLAIDFARVFYFAVTLENCARNGAYYASNYPGIYSYTSAKQAALQDANNLTPALQDTDIDVEYGTSQNGPFNSTTPISDGYVQVKVTWTFQSVTNFPPIPTSMTLTRTCIMKMAPITPTLN